MKKLTAFLLAAVLTFSMTGCGGGAPTPVPSDTPLSTPANTSDTPVEMQNVTIKLGFNGDFTTMADAVIGATERVNERYAKEGKNIKVTMEADYQTIANNEFQNNVIFAHKSGDAPDVYLAGTDVTPYVAANCILDITDAISDAMVPGITRPATVDGKIYALPFDLPLRVIYYSENDLRKIGWTDEQITALPLDIASGKVTLEDFIALCEEVVKKGGATYGLAHRPSAGNDFYDLLNALGGEYYNENGELVFDEAGILRLFELLYKNAQVTKITPENLNQMGFDTINKMVGTGEAFAYFGPMFSATYVANAAGLDTDAFSKQERFVLFPKSANSAAPFATAAPQFMAISSDTKYPDICKDIFRELQGGSADLMAHHGAVTFSLSSITAANQMGEITTSPILAPVTYMEKYTKTIPSIKNSTTLRGFIFDQIVSLELGQTTPEKAIADVKAQATLNIDGLIMK